MQAQFKYKCQCLGEIPVKCRKPGVVAAVVVTARCPECDSVYLLRLTLSQQPRTHRLDTTVIKFTPSEELVELLREEADFNAQQRDAERTVQEAGL